MTLLAAISMEYLPWAVLLAIGACLSFMYSGLETGIYLMNKSRLDLRAESGSKAARLVRRVIHSPGNLLAVLLIGSNVAEYVATFAVSAMFLLAGYGDRVEWYTVAVVAPGLFIFCESLPKNLAQRAAERFVYRFAPLLRASSVLFNACGLAGVVRGFAWALMKLVRARQQSYIPMGHQGLAAVVADSQAAGVLTHTQTVMADRVMHITQVRLKNAMIPMAKVAYAPAQVTHEQMLELMRAHNFSRFPMLDGAAQVVAILNIYDALAAADNEPPTGKTLEPLVLGEDMAVTDALYRMQRSHSPMAIVADASGKHVGIATVKDLVEEIVGELDAW